MKKVIIVFMIFLPVICAAQGALLMVGGGGENYNTWSDEPYGWFVIKADSGKIINIDADEVASFYPEYFESLGADVASTSLQIANRTVANDSATYFELISAKGIFIEGGDQYDYVSNWKGTLVEDAIHYVFNNGGAIGGTSAGLAVLGDVVFDARFGSAYPEDAAYNPYDSFLHMEDDFLHILPNVLTDSHFHSRGRLGRIVPMMAQRIQDNGQTNIMGIGIADKTALCVEPDLTTVTYGMATVTILYGDESSLITCTPGVPLTFTDIHFDQLIHGVRYDLNTRTVLDPGPDLGPLPTPPPAATYTDTMIDGSLDEAMDLGAVTISGLESNYLNAWHGNLLLSAGDNIVPQTVIIPKVWEYSTSGDDREFYENRIVGGMYAAAENPHYAAIYLDSDTNVQITTESLLIPETLAYVLDTRNAVYVGITSTRFTNYPAIIGARLHFLGPGAAYDLNAHTAVTSLENGIPAMPGETILYDNFPNPFNNRTVFRYHLAQGGYVSLRIFNLIGQPVASLVNSRQAAGYHEVDWDTGDLSSGLYLYQLQSADKVQLKKCVLLK